MNKAEGLESTPDLQNATGTLCFSAENGGKAREA
jgi:hypothetical protein